MANLGRKFDASEHDTDSHGQYDELPDGIYELEIEASEVKENSKGNGTILKTTAVVLRPEEFKDRKFFDTFNLEHSNPQAQEIGQRQFAQLCRAIGVVEVEDSEELHFRSYVVKIGLGKPSKEKDESGNPRYPARAEVKRYFYPDEGNVPEPEAASPAAERPSSHGGATPPARHGQSASRAAQAGASSGPAKKRPWGK
ncbi:DUF669 domain-containing protein [Consotaella salsifontis]|uniref:DUF669 domain-containing protein n=1 Tax=Consotaella salsifontis TaxID=1365950 RepID=A0A1T4RW16_9HYPH|nr:DUF669 domain-containing protein [Consotaella salsifontis]SKA20163.1 Protein of unknown function [Consotaella salsifontis]